MSTAFELDHKLEDEVLAEREKGLSIEKLQFQNLSLYYDSDNRIIDDCSFDFPMDQNIWIEGQGGRGKSTLLKILAGLSQPQEGRYLVNGHWVGDMTFEEFLPWRLKIGYAFDLGGLLNNRTLAENIKLPVMYHAGDQIEKYEIWVDQLLDHFELGEERNLRPASVSGGQRKLACILRAVSMKPEVLLLDDPDTGLGSVLSKKLAMFLDKSRREGWLKHVYVTSADQHESHYTSPLKQIMDDLLTIDRATRKVVVL